MIAQKWRGASDTRSELLGGRLVIHRIPLDGSLTPASSPVAAPIPRALLESSLPVQSFAWQAALLAEELVNDGQVEVIESPEWEAPLYYFQLRRRLGLGPRLQPPCVIHLHSPTERIYAANAWDTSVADYSPAASVEAASIAMADKLICPSRYVAEQAISRYGLPPGSVSVIPYPIGDMPEVERSSAVWSGNSVCFVGRLEARKGVLELAEALGLVGDEGATLRLDLVGADTPLEATGEGSILAVARHAAGVTGARRLKTHGVLAPAHIRKVLSKCSAAIVPSRWDNLPYTCLEAMASGLPVIVSPQGGMKEIVVDGASGWVAEDASPAGIAAALQRMLRTSDMERRRMGQQARAHVLRYCDNDSILHGHLDLKASLATRGDGASRVFTEPETTSTGIEVSVEGTTRHLHLIPADDRCTIAGRVLRTTDNASVDMSSLGRQNRDQVIVLLDRTARVVDDLPEILTRMFTANPRLAVASGWIGRNSDGSVLVPDLPSHPHRARAEGLWPLIALRVACLEDAEGASAVEPLARRLDRVLDRGWTALTYPSVVATVSRFRKTWRTAQEPVYSAASVSLQLECISLGAWIRRHPRNTWRLFKRGVASPRNSIHRVAQKLFRRTAENAGASGRGRAEPSA